MVKTAWFTIAKMWKQHKHLSLDDWIKKMCHKHTVEYSVQFSHSVMPDTLWPHGLQHAKLPCPITNSWSLLKLMSIDSVMPSNHLILCVPSSSCLQSFPASGFLQMSQFFASDGQSTGVSASASVLPMTIQDWFPLELTGWISLQSKGLSRVFSNTIIQKHQFFSAQLSL